MSRRLAIGGAYGGAWGVVATAVFLAMFRSLIPAPSEAGFPLGFALVALYLPFVVALGLEVLVGRSAQALVEVVGVTVASGAGLRAILSAAIPWARALARNTAPPR